MKLFGFWIISIGIHDIRIPNIVVVRWQKNNEKVGKEAREVKRKSKQIVAEGLKRNEKDRRGWKRRRGEGDRWRNILLTTQQVCSNRPGVLHEAGFYGWVANPPNTPLFTRACDRLRLWKVISTHRVELPEQRMLLANNMGTKLPRL